MAFVPLLVGGLIGWAASKIGGSDEQKPAQQAPAQATGSTDLPAPPTPAPQAQSQATAAATGAQQKARRKAAAGSTAMTTPRTARRGPAAGPAVPQETLAKVSLLGG